jgi:exosortase/archaeosortase family protein
MPDINTITETAPGKHPITLLRKVLKDRIVLFVLKFAVLFAVLYWVNFAIIALRVPGGYYNEWVAQHLGYADVLRTGLVRASSWVLEMCGFDNRYDATSVHIPGVIKVRVAYVCMGFGLVAFCWAFVIAYPQPLKRKLFYIVAGTLTIITLNIIRIAGLTMIFATKAFRVDHDGHHTAFNIVVYIFLFLLVVRMMNEGTKNRAGAGPTDA